MKKIVFGIFAHPDDEAFGPAGTLLLESLSGNDVHIITLTAGENGTNPDQLADLKSARLKEWRAAGELMKVASLENFDYEDGKLDNSVMQLAAERIRQRVSSLIASYSEPVECDFIAFDLSGLSGHIDHIVASRAACLAFYRLKQQGLPMGKLRLFCLPREAYPEANIDWLYMEPGRQANEIDETIDASEHYQTILSIIRTHHTQRGDGEKHIQNQGRDLGINHFITLE